MHCARKMVNAKRCHADVAAAWLPCLGAPRSWWQADEINLCCGISIKRILLPMTVALLPMAAQAEYAPTILHTNDFHNRFKPINGCDSTCDAETAIAIDGDRANCRAVECQMGNLVAEAMLARVADQDVTIALANGSDG